MLVCPRKNLQKDLQKSLAHANIIDDISMTAETLNKNGGHGRTPRRKQLLSKKTLLHIWSLQKSTWMFPSTTGNIFCGQMKPKLSCLEGTHNAMCGGKKKSQHTNMKWFGAASLPQGLDRLRSSTEKWIPKFYHLKSWTKEIHENLCFFVRY